MSLDSVHQPAKGLLAGFESQNKAPRAYALACHDAEQSAIRADINEAVPFFQPLHLVGDDIVIGAKDAMAIGSVAWIQPKLDRTIMRPHRGATAQRLHPLRSEEHTSEIQSLMRISTASFSLKKKKQ